MARKVTYRQKLRDPRWQKKRLEIMERADWRCEWCGTGEVNLQVHHGFYGKDVEPWEYESDTLYCLCDSCHERAETIRRTVYCELARIHPRLHEHVRDLLTQILDMVAEDETLLARTVIERS